MFFTDGIKMGDELRFNSHFNGNSLNGTAFTPKGSVGYSKGQRELASDGYEKFNIDDDDGVYIARMPERALFNDGEPVFVKAQSGVFVGSSWNSSDGKVEPRQVRKSSNPRDLFANIQRGFDYEIRTHVGTYDKGKVVEQQPITDFVSRMNDRLTGTNAVSQTASEMSLTSSAEERPKVDMSSVNKDNVQVRSLEKPRVQKKFVFVNGKLVQVEVKAPRIKLDLDSDTVSQ